MADLIDASVTHGNAYRYKQGCRCDECRLANTVRHRKHRARRRQRDVPAGVEHGAAAASNWGCKCAVCRDAVAERNRQLEERLLSGGIRHRSREIALRRCPCDDCAAARRGERGVPSTVAHGTSAAYQCWGCRCDDCEQWVARQSAGMQGRTTIRADRAKSQWTGADLELIVTRTDLSVTELAAMLGRTYYAVRSARHKATRDPKWVKVAGVSDS